MGTPSTLNWGEECVQVVRNKAEKTDRELQYSRHKIMTSTVNGDKPGGSGNDDKTLDDFDGRTDRIS